MAVWDQQSAIALCRLIEGISPDFGAHVALTGGTLYKDGGRKDCDVLFYRIRQVDKIDKSGLFEALAMVGLRELGGRGWCHKLDYKGKPVDAFFPEDDGVEYDRDGD